MGRLIVIEPHADDVFISLGGHIESMWESYEILIVTVFCDPKREQEAKDYAEIMGCENVCLCAAGHRDMKEEGEGRNIPELQEYLEEAGEGEIIGPLGLQHPDHKSVRTTLDWFRTQREILGVYCDIPYYTKLLNQSEAFSEMSGREVKSVLTPGKRKWRHREIFKSQAKFFHFNPLWEHKIPEIVLSATKNPPVKAG